MSLQNQPKPKVTSAKRRALIKGSASAVPMVLTLRSGAAFAAGSAESCVARIQDNPPLTPPKVLVPDSDSDNWVRAVTTRRVIKEKEGGSSFAVFRDPAFNEGDPDAHYYRATQNTQNSDSFKYMPASGSQPAKMQNNTGNQTFSIEEEDHDWYVLCLVDRNGKPFSPPTYGADFENGEFPFATNSCVASLDNTPLTP